MGVGSWEMGVGRAFDLKIWAQFELERDRA